MQPLEMEVVSKEQSGAIEQMESAQIDKQISTAKRYPRDLAQVRDEMMSAATVDEVTAQSVFYRLPRGGKSIEGPSIRLAEIAISCWGNIRVQNRVVETVAGGDHPHVMVRAEVFDLQKNVAVAVEKRRRITGKKNRDTGVSRLPDDDDINLATNSCSAIAIRDAVFKVIPLAFIKPVFEQAKKVAIGDAKTLADRRAKCIESFAKMGVTQDRILLMLERTGINDITLEDIGTLIGVFNAIRDGEQTIEEAFPTKAAAPAGPKIEVPSVLTPVAPQIPTPLPTSSEATSPKPTPPEPVATTPELGKALESILRLAKRDGVSEGQIMDFAHRQKMAKSEQKTLNQISDGKLRNIAGNWETALADIKASTKP